jgi:predicted transposase/invertase (TIGR01784 family)
MSRYINPYTDFGFKKLFGEEANKDLLIDFLNSVLPEKYQIAELEFQNTENLPDLPEQRQAFFDIFCKTPSGEQFIVEMQKASQHYFRDRAVFYSTFPIRKQAQKGENWDFALKPVYFVAILNFEYDKEEDKRKFFREVKLKDQDGDAFYEKLNYYFFQMPQFTLEVSELKTHQDKWFYFLKNLTSFEDIPAILREPIFEKAFDTAEYTNLSLPELEQYERDMMIFWENYAVIETARMQGEEKGKMEGKTETARNLKKLGVSMKIIAESTGLSEKEISAL